nr:hypothetical protein [Smithella sp.]
MTNRDSVTLLFSSAGRRVALMNNFRKAAKELGLHVNIVAVDMDPLWSPACEAADVAFPVPRCTAEDFMPQMLDICRKQKVDLIIPTIDTEL